MLRSALVVAPLAGCAVMSPATVQAREQVPGIDGLTLDESITPTQLNAKPHKFRCRVQDDAGRYQFCWPEGPESLATVVILLDGRVSGFMRTFDPGLTDAAEQWSLALMGIPTRRQVTDGRTDLLWADKEAPFARLHTAMEDFGAQSAFLVMTRNLERYLGEHPDLLETTPESNPTREEMTPGRCFALPLLCPAA